MGRLEGRVAIITGADGEFGKAITPGFAAEGFDFAPAVTRRGPPARRTPIRSLPSLDESVPKQV